MASLIIVGMPHIAPCPAPRQTMADAQICVTADGQRVIRRRRKQKTATTSESDAQSTTAVSSVPEEVQSFRELQEEQQARTRTQKAGRECPVPKPGGVLGRMLGFEKGESRDGDEGDGEGGRQ